MKKEKNAKPKSKTRKIIEWVFTGILGLAFAFVAVCNLCKLITRGDHYGYGNSFGFGQYSILTESMEPVYPKNSVIITYDEDPEEIVKQWNEIKDLNLDPTDERNINLTFVNTLMPNISTGIAKYNDQTNSRFDEEIADMPMTHQLFNVKIDESKQEGEGRYTFFVHGINTDGWAAREGQYQAFTEKELLGVVKTNSKFLGTVSGFISSVWGLLILLLIPCLYLVVTSVLDIFKACSSEDEEEEMVDGAANNGGAATLSQKDYESLKQQMIDEMLNGKKGDKK